MGGGVGKEGEDGLRVTHAIKAGSIDLGVTVSGEGGEEGLNSRGTTHLDG